MGSVYLAHDLTLDRPVAIKVINPDVASNPALRDRFLLEARTVARLRHPNIVPVHAAAESDGLLYFVMGFVQGDSLRELLTREGRLDPVRAERVLREMGLALDHAHVHGLVHRDVKPENILIERDTGTAMLTDFGVARAVEPDGGSTQTGVIIGSPRYMSPEQASGDRTLDGRSDLYSLALVGYEMCTGEPVVLGSSVAGMLVKHVSESPPPVAQRVSGLPSRLGDAIDRGLAKAPDRRWQTGREFADALSGPAQTPRRKRGLIAMAVTAVVGALVAWLASRPAAPVRSGLVVIPFEIQSSDQDVTWLREGSASMLALTFGQWTDLKVVDYERTLGMLDAEGLGGKARLTLDDALRLAHRAQAASVVIGQVQTTRDSLIVVAKLFDVRSGKSEHQAQEGGARRDDPRPLFDRLAQRLLQIQGAYVSSIQLARATTTSLEAYRAYLDGVRHLQAWRLPAADAEFARAIALDSTFALAYHKRSLGLGWSQADNAVNAAATERAFALAARLPPRERSLVEGNYHLTRALLANRRRDTTLIRREYEASILAYQGLISRGDSLAAEAWYGLADAYYHVRFGVPGNNGDTTRWYTTRALRDFNRTLAIDSTYHLAYAHLVELYTGAATGSRLLISGDSALLVVDSTDVRRLGGAVAIQKLRGEAGMRGVQIAQAWARADRDSPQPILQLSDSYFAVDLPDSAIAVLANALNRPELASPTLRLNLLADQVLVGDSGIAATERYVLDRYTPDSLLTIAPSGRFIAGAIMTAAGAIGRAADVDRAYALLGATDSVLPTTTTPMRPMWTLHRDAMHLGLGDSVTPELKRSILQGARWLDTISGSIGEEVRSNSVSVPYLAYLTTRDTAFRVILRRWVPNEMPELDAIAALSRGDSAEAKHLAQSFPTPDSLRKPAVTYSAGGLRSVARAIVWEAIGERRMAVETYEAITIPRINVSNVSEPGYPVWVRGLLAQARLWSVLGETARATAAYEEFIRRWKGADGAAAEQVKEAVRELARLRDSPRDPT